MVVVGVGVILCVQWGSIQASDDLNLLQRNRTIGGTLDIDTFRRSLGRVGIQSDCDRVERRASAVFEWPADGS